MTFGSIASELSFMPHGHCYLWLPSLLWLEVGSNTLIGIAYVAISVTLVLFRLRVRELPLQFLYSAFGLFIIACGFTHFMDVWVIWQPRYWLDAGLRVVTAVASVGTAAILPHYVPQAVNLARSMQATRRQGVELAAALDDVGNLYRKTRELNELKTSFFANVSHELRTPLTLITTPLANLLRRNDLPADAVPELKTALRNARLLTSLVNDLLDIQKLDAGKLLPTFAPVELAALIRETTAQFELVARERDIAFVVELPDAIRASVDANKIQRATMNLLSNAFKFTPLHGQIRVTLCVVDGADGTALARLEVADNGPGVPESERERLFERFSQGRASHQGAGTGLGLSIVRELVQLHGGTVTVDGSEFAGACFVVQLPLTQPHAMAEASSSPRLTVAAEELRDVALAGSDADAETHAAAETAVSSETAGARARVMVVDDNHEMRKLLARMLSERYEVLEAPNGQNALGQLHESEPDLVVSDLMMPALSGDQLIRAIRATDGWSQLPILILTAKADQQLRARLLRSGAQDYLFKPFDTSEFLARVHNLVSMRRAQRLLQRELEASQADVELLTQGVVAQKRQLEIALAAVSSAREEAERASRQKSDFLSLVSHELRTPLTSMRLQMERITRGLTGPLTQQQTEVTARIVRSSARLSGLIESLLQFTRIESGRIAPTSAVVDLVATARDVVDDLRASADAKSLALRVVSSDESIPFTSDPQLVRLILVNLCENAIKYTKQGEVVVRVERTPGGAVHLQVTDTGPGIAQDAQVRVFQPFEQLEDVQHKRGPGVGLGLALVERIAGALGAVVSLESRLGVGSRFSVAFPTQAPSPEPPAP